MYGNMPEELGEFSTKPRKNMCLVSHFKYDLLQYHIPMRKYVNTYL